MPVYKNICRIFAEAINRKVFKLLFQTKFKTFIFSLSFHISDASVYPQNIPAAAIFYHY